MIVVTPEATALSVAIHSRRREHPLPCPLAAGVRQLAVERTHVLELSPQLPLCCAGQHRPAVLGALPAANDDLPPLEVHVLDPEPQALEKPEPAAVEKHRDESRSAVELVKDASHFLTREHDRNPLRYFGAPDALDPSGLLPQHFLVQEEQRAQRLILRRRADAILDRERRQELADLRFAHLAWMTHLGRIPEYRPRAP
jgi:hypothetical protein